MTDELIQNFLVPVAVGGLATTLFIIVIWAGLALMENCVKLSDKYKIEWKKILDILWISFVAIMFFWLIGYTILGKT